MGGSSSAPIVLDITQQLVNLVDSDDEDGVTYSAEKKGRGVIEACVKCHHYLQICVPAGCKIVFPHLSSHIKN